MQLQIAQHPQAATNSELTEDFIISEETELLWGREERRKQFRVTVSDWSRYNLNVVDYDDDDYAVSPDLC